MVVVMMRAEGSAEENASGISVGRVSVVRIAIGIPIIGRRGVVTIGAREGDTDANKDSCLGRRRWQGNGPDAQRSDQHYSETLEPGVP